MSKEKKCALCWQPMGDEDGSAHGSCMDHEVFLADLSDSDSMDDLDNAQPDEIDYDAPQEWPSSP
jgi:hypothetical protein